MIDSFDNSHSQAPNSEQQIADKYLLTELEEHKLLIEWNETASDYPRKCIHKLFEATVEQSPDAIAVVFEGEQLTYRELNASANQLAHHLKTLGVGPEVLVGICVERSLEMMVGLLGILKAGGAYVPLDPAYPQERLAFILDDAAVSILLTQSQLAQELPTHSVQAIYLDKDWKDIDQHSQENLTQDAKASNLAYVIYTSGSTGTPKGVLVEHQAVNRLVLNTNYINLQPQDSVAFISNFSFDAATFEIWGALLQGARLVIFSKDIALLSHSFAVQISKQRITVLFLTTALFSLFVREIPSALKEIKYLLFGGEAVDPKRVKEALQNVAPQHLLHVYGPTESTTFATYHPIKVVLENAATIPIGRPISNTSCFILNAQLQPVPIGCTGELYLGGDGLARGYLNRPDLTQEKFVLNPFNNEPESRLYKTGDLARYLPDGNIEFIGRIDHQVKIRGFRIELNEIEASLAQHPDVQQAVVVVREDVPGDKRLVAYCITEQATIHELREFLQQRLPEFMLPNAFIRLDALPLTPNGKIDRRALPVPEKTRSKLKDSFVIPRTSIETALAKIWSEVLRLDQIGIYDEFLELGGHSLLAAQIISRIASTLKVELSIASLFTASTIAELAKQIEVDRQDESFLAPPIQIVARDQPLPLSYAQERLWFLAQLESSLPVYNEPFTIRFPSAIDTNALEKAINEMIRRHESLRTRFIAVEGQPFQIIDPPSSFYLRVVDLRQLPLEQRETEALQIATLEAKQPFDLAIDRLLRATLIQLTDDDYRLFLTMHHILMDGVSIYNVFLPELATLYEANTQECVTSIAHDQFSPFAALPVQYADFAIWQRQQLQGEALTHHLDYWKQQLGGELPTLQLPTDRSRSARGCYAL